jgi:ParB-like chromosome segregation protein Spo0J
MLDYVDLKANDRSTGLYEVQFNELEVYQPSDQDLDQDANLLFFNPRFLSASEENPLGEGFSTEELNALEDSIIKNGLLQPISCRVIEKEGDKRLQVVEGHRRYHTLSKLIKENKNCFNPAQNTFVPASELYKNVVVRIYQKLSDKKAYQLSFDDEKTKIKYGQTTEIQFVLFCRKKNVPDNEILSMLNRNQQWLKSIQNILNKLTNDKKSLEAVLTGKLNVSSASKISEIPDPEIRSKILEVAEVEANEVKKRTQNGMEKSIKRSEKQKKILENKLSSTNKQTEKQIQKTKNDIDNLVKEIEEKTNKKDSLVPRIKTTHIDDALLIINGEKPKKKTPEEIIQYWDDEIINLIKDPKEYDPQVLNMISDLFCSLKSGSLKIELFLNQWKDKISSK